jgi:hypothetical protein
MAYEIVRQSETITDVTEETTIERKWTVGPNSKLAMFQLCYVVDGLVYETETFSTSAKAEIFVDVTLSCTKHILGLPDLNMVLVNIRPEHDNIGEWSEIRGVIIQSSDRNEETAFKQFVTQLGRTIPDRHNIGEWVVHHHAV